jgi:23S rRNA (guanosine2251-2'-O)-methyltransferase
VQRVFGIHAVESLLRRAPGRVLRLHVQAGRDDRRMTELLELALNQGVVVDRLERRRLDELADGRHQGVVAEVEEADQVTGEQDLPGLLDAVGEPLLLLVLDGVTDPHNLGACLRSADAAGAHAVLVTKDKSAPLNETARKVASGAAETVPLVRVTNLGRALERLKARGVWLYGAAGEAENTLYDNDLRGDVAFVMGAEGGGLRRLTRDKCDYLVKLPMAGAVGSLNVSVATGICLFEAVRQRREN